MLSLSTGTRPRLNGLQLKDQLQTKNRASNLNDIIITLIDSVDMEDTSQSDKLRRIHGDCNLKAFHIFVYIACKT